MAFSLLVPGEVRTTLDRQGLNHRPILLSVDTDIALDGHPDRVWLVVTPDHLSVIHDHRDPLVLQTIEWSQVLSVRSVAGVGSGLLQARTETGWIDLLRYSNAHAERFHKIAGRLEAIREKPQDASWLHDHTHEEPLDPPRCPQCSLRLTNRDENCPRCLQRGQIIRRVTDLLRPYLRGAVVLSLLTVVGVVAELIPPKLQQYLVDDVLGSRSGTSGSPSFTTALLVVVLALAFSRVLLSIVGVIKGRIATVIGTGLTSSLRAEMVRKLQSLAVVYYDRHQVGSTLSRVAHDSEVLHGLMHQLTGGFLLQTAQLIGVGAMLLWLNPKLAMYTLIPVPLVFLGSWVFWKKVYPRYYRLWDASSKQMSALNGMLSGIRVVKSFAQEPREFERYQKANEHLRQWRLWVDHTNAQYSAAMQLVFSLGGLIVWYVGGRDVIGQEMTLGELIAFLAYLAMFYAPLSALSSFTTWLTSFLSGSKRVLELLDTPLTVTEPSHPVEWTSARGSIRFENVTFGYDRNQPVLKDVSFEVQPGEMVGIVGRSGSGKTTMVNLLGRFYDVQSGRITIDGIDVRDMSMRNLRERLGIVFQDSFLFRGTIFKNIAYGRPQSSIDEVLSAAVAAGAHDFICRAPLGYETLLGEHGAGLSGGEKQRLSIARTLLYDPCILVLDEATSNIDAEAERSIQKALERLIAGRTTVAIAHRLSTLRNADRILVFDRGKLVEQGSHAELLRFDGVYARLVRIQTQVSKDPNIDRLLDRGQGDDASPMGDTRPLSEASTAKTGSLRKDGLLPAGESNDLGSEEKTNRESSHAMNWLTSGEDVFSEGERGELCVTTRDGTTIQGLFLVRTFPATHPDEYLSVRRWNESGDDEEIGLIRHVADWSEAERELIEKGLRRRYLLREINRIHTVELKFGFLDFDVSTEAGRQRFSMRWTQSQAVDFGEKGKLIIDTEENRYVVKDLDALVPQEREKFMQYVYW